MEIPSKKSLSDLYKNLYDYYSNKNKNEFLVTANHIKNVEKKHNINVLFKKIHGLSNQDIEEWIPDIKNLKTIQFPTLMVNELSLLINDVYEKENEKNNMVTLKIKKNKTADDAKTLFGKMIFDLVGIEPIVLKRPTVPTIPKTKPELIIPSKEAEEIEKLEQQRKILLKKKKSIIKETFTFDESTKDKPPESLRKYVSENLYKTHKRVGPKDLEGSDIYEFMTPESIDTLVDYTNKFIDDTNDMTEMLELVLDSLFTEERKKKFVEVFNTSVSYAFSQKPVMIPKNDSDFLQKESLFFQLEKNWIVVLNRLMNELNIEEIINRSGFEIDEKIIEKSNELMYEFTFQNYLRNATETYILFFFDHFKNFMNLIDKNGVVEAAKTVIKIKNKMFSETKKKLEIDLEYDVFINAKTKKEKDLNLNCFNYLTTDEKLDEAGKHILHKFKPYIWHVVRERYEKYTELIEEAYNILELEDQDEYKKKVEEGYEKLKIEQMGTYFKNNGPIFAREWYSIFFLGLQSMSAVFFGMTSSPTGPNIIQKEKNEVILKHQDLQGKTLNVTDPNFNQTLKTFNLSLVNISDPEFLNPPILPITEPKEELTPLEQYEKKQKKREQLKKEQIEEIEIKESTKLTTTEVEQRILETYLNSDFKDIIVKKTKTSDLLNKITSADPKIVQEAVSDVVNTALTRKKITEEISHKTIEKMQKGEKIDEDIIVNDFFYHGIDKFIKKYMFEGWITEKIGDEKFNGTTPFLALFPNLETEIKNIIISQRKNTFSTNERYAIDKKIDQALLDDIKSVFVHLKKNYNIMPEWEEYQRNQWLDMTIRIIYTRTREDIKKAIWTPEEIGWTCYAPYVRCEFKINDNLGTTEIHYSHETVNKITEVYKKIQHKSPDEIQKILTKELEEKDQLKLDIMKKLPEQQLHKTLKNAMYIIATKDTPRIKRYLELSKSIPEFLTNSLGDLPFALRIAIDDIIKPQELFTLANILKSGAYGIVESGYSYFAGNTTLQDMKKIEEELAKSSVGTDENLKEKFTNLTTSAIQEADIMDRLKPISAYLLMAHPEEYISFHIALTGLYSCSSIILLCLLPLHWLLDYVNKLEKKKQRLTRTQLKQMKEEIDKKNKKRIEDNKKILDNLPHGGTLKEYMKHFFKYTYTKLSQITETLLLNIKDTTVTTIGLIPSFIRETIDLTLVTTWYIVKISTEIIAKIFAVKFWFPVLLIVGSAKGFCLITSLVGSKIVPYFPSFTPNNIMTLGTSVLDTITSSSVGNYLSSFIKKQPAKPDPKITQNLQDIWGTKLPPQQEITKSTLYQAFRKAKKTPLFKTRARKFAEYMHQSNVFNLLGPYLDLSTIVDILYEPENLIYDPARFALNRQFSTLITHFFVSPIKTEVIMAAWERFIKIPSFEDFFYEDWTLKPAGIKTLKGIFQTTVICLLYNGLYSNQGFILFGYGDLLTTISDTMEQTYFYKEFSNIARLIRAEPFQKLLEQ